MANLAFYDNRMEYSTNNFIVVAESREAAIKKVAAFLGGKAGKAFLKEIAKTGKTFGDCSLIEVSEHNLATVIQVSQEF